MAMVERTPMQEVCVAISGDSFGQKLKQALPPSVSLEKFTRVTLTAVQQTPDLITADLPSLFNSIVKCAQDGLLPDGREAALVIFNVKGEKRVSYLPMIFGLRKKAAEHSFSLTAYVVYEHDTFDYHLGIDPSITHDPPALGVERGNPIGAYAVATDKRTGEKYLEVMSLKEIEQVRAVSKAATSPYGPWVNWWGEQARKTVAKRLFKQLPLGAIDERTEGVLDAIDAEYELPTDPVMSLAEANVSAGIGNGTVPLDDSGPDDTLVDAARGREQVEDAERIEFGEVQ